MTKRIVSIPDVKVDELLIPTNFQRYGIYIKKGLFLPAVVDQIRLKVLRIFDGVHSTGIQPDKIKLSRKDTGEGYMHSICNGWKSDVWIKKFIVNSGLRDLTSKLTGWRTVKLNQDSMFNVLPGSEGVTAFHQDNAYQNWHTSKGGIITAWLALSKLKPNSGGIEYLIGSHLMKSDIKRLSGEFIVSKDNPYEELDRRFGDNWMEKYPLFRPDLEPGDVIFHHGNLWHGSCPNLSSESRVSVSIHLMEGDAKFSSVDVNPFFNKFKLDESDEMHSSFFPDIY